MRQGRSADREPGAASGTRAVDPVFLLAAALAMAAGLLGGASRENPLRLAVVELTAVPLLAMGLRAVVRGRLPDDRPGRQLDLWIIAAAVGIPLLQLAPVPPEIWTRLPGQAARLTALRVLGRQPPWLPMSLAPAATFRAILALTPPLAMYLAIVRLSADQTHRLSWLWLGLAALGLMLGVGQMVEPGGGPAYLYATASVDSLVGVFANRNHEAAFLVCLAPVAAAIGLPPRPKRSERGNGSRTSWRRWLGALFIAVAFVALSAVRSRAGVLLAGPALAAALLVIWRGRGRGEADRWRQALPVAAAAAVAVAAVALFALTPILARFDTGGSDLNRGQFWPIVMDAAQPFEPLGAGVGAFDRVFAAVEPLTLVGPRYLNHAHNDFLEIWLEAGWPGLAVVGAFLVWLVLANLRAWRSRSALARAAGASVVLLLVFSVPDYPLRTETLAVFLAFCCGVLAAPTGSLA